MEQTTGKNERLPSSIYDAGGVTCPKATPFLKKTPSKGNHIPATMEFAVAGSGRTAVQPSLCPLKGTNTPPCCSRGCDRGEEQWRPGSLRVHRARAHSEDSHQMAGLREGGLATLGWGGSGGSQSSPRHLRSGSPEGRARLLMVVCTGETLGINETERGSDWVLNSRLNYLIFSLRLGFPCVKCKGTYRQHFPLTVVS